MRFDRKLIDISLQEQNDQQVLMISELFVWNAPVKTVSNCQNYLHYHTISSLMNDIEYYYDSETGSTAQSIFDM